MSLWGEEGASASAVDVVVLARDGLAAAQRCLASLYGATCRAMREIIVIDDASADPALKAWLDGEAGSGRVTLLRNGGGKGFAVSINRAFASHPERDVVLLEGNVEVANDWLDRLLACSRSQVDIGTVTPFSSSALFCAYPFAGWEGGLPGTSGLSTLDALAASVNAGLWAELPSAEKFCMLIRRACLDMIGFFDVERFGRGSGEAKDFSRRAAAVGWRNVLAANVFVYRSVGTVPDFDRMEGIEDSEYKLAALYPDYAAKVRDFAYFDPPAKLRARIDRARAGSGGSEFASVMDEQAQKRALHTASQADAPLEPPLPTVLHITHEKSGSGRWVKDYCAADLNCRNLILCGQSSRNAATAKLALFDPRQGALPLMVWTLAEPIRSVAAEHAEAAGIVKWICAAFDVRALLVSSLMGGSFGMLRLGLPTVLTVHDLFPFCPALSGFFGKPCEACDASSLARCLQENPHNVFWHLSNAGDWQALRAAFTECLTAGNVRVVVPDEELRLRWAAFCPEAGVQSWPCVSYGLGAAFTRGPVAAERGSGEGAARATQADAPLPRLRVLIPGPLLPHTGLNLWRKVCDELRAFANVLLLDCGDFGLPFADCSGVEVAHECDFAKWPEKVAQWNPDCALLLSLQPEDFCYALLEMQALSVPVVAVRAGAGSERIDNGWNGFLVEPETDAVLDILRSLDQSRERLATVADILRFSPVRTAFDMVADYRKLLPELGKAGIEIEAGGGRETEILLSILGKRLRGQEEILRLKDLLQARDEENRARALNQRRLESMVGTLAAQHAAILRSSSWKASAPVRYFGRLWERLRGRIAPPPEKPQVVRSARMERRKAPRPEWPVPLMLRSRASARYWLCEAIGVPDASVIIAGGGPDQSQRALQNFVALADAVAYRSARACFVWCGRLDNLRSDDMLALELLREVGDLFVLDTQLDAEVFAGADVLLLPAETVGQAGFNGTVAGIAHVELPLDPAEAGAGAVMAATVTRLLHYCANTDKTDTQQAGH
ncbi:MAG: glycosyltransferase [Azoarcus sp.]|jgi:GT2 family glycosyltransferase/glycosyltransferase involved in cell wall biosynthesis|nr:glycosyltransferase [Azoarcus sp.]